VTTARPLADVLRAHTGTADDVFFGIWHGFGYIAASAPTLPLPDREHWLLRGPVELAAANMAPEPWEQSASLWWPADRAWFVATDIDLVTTYVGGSAACVRALRDDTGLEVAAVPVDQRVTWDADTVNPLPARG
jgi:hypothetical protein